MYYYTRSFLQADPIFCIFLFTIKLLWEIFCIYHPYLETSWYSHLNLLILSFTSISATALHEGYPMIFMWLSPMSTFKTLSYQTLSLIGDTFAFSVVLFYFPFLLLKHLLLIFFCRILYHFLLQRVIPRISVLAHFSSMKLLQAST